MIHGGFVTERFSSSFVQLYDSLCLASFPPCNLFQTLRFFGTVETGDNRVPGPRIPVLVAPRQCHSRTLSWSWKDQGWGHQKGQVWIIASAVNKLDKLQHSTEDPFGGGRVVYASMITPHEMTRMQVTFAVVHGEQYRLWYKVGGGGGHELFLREGIVHCVIYDEPSRCWARAAHALAQANVLSTLQYSHPMVAAPAMFLRMFLEVCWSLCEDMASGREPSPRLVALLEEYGIAVERGVLQAVQELVLRDSMEQLRTKAEDERLTDLQTEYRRIPGRRLRLRHLQL